ncbi:MAG: hypothetical protein DMF04_04835 [Verrucomicrobia bacterium]|nr:MAG: hypothetical protein DMF04_04835 [Verrucomicrobiota bacterium]
MLRSRLDHEQSVGIIGQMPIAVIAAARYCVHGTTTVVPVAQRKQQALAGFREACIMNLLPQLPRRLGSSVGRAED